MSRFGRSALAAIAVVAASVAAYGQAPPQLTGIVPDSGPVGSEVTLYGSGFAATGNTVIFGLGSRDYPSGGIMPDLPSGNGGAIKYVIPDHYAPACRFSSRPCPFAFIRVLPGTYAVAVENANGRSNSKSFTVKSP